MHTSFRNDAKHIENTILFRRGSEEPSWKKAMVRHTFFFTEQQKQHIKKSFNDYFNLLLIEQTNMLCFQKNYENNNFSAQFSGSVPKMIILI